jgi:hypothetical protein
MLFKTVEKKTEGVTAKAKTRNSRNDTGCTMVVDLEKSTESVTVTDDDDPW